jgi:ATP-dependent Clp protease ATP-binding subunit ClpA
VFERLDPAARRALELAHQEAVDLHHNYLGTEHLLIGLSRTSGFPARLLNDLGCGPNVVRAAMIKIIGRGRPRRDRAQLLASIGVDLGEVRRRAEATFGSEAIVSAASRVGTRQRRRPPRWWPNCSVSGSCESTLTGGWLGMAPRLKTVLDMAARQAAPALATPTHLLLAVVEEGKGVACQILERRGIDLETVASAAREEFRRGT